MNENKQCSDSIETDEVLNDAVSDVPPSGEDSPSEKAIKAWNALCAKMVEVIKTIRKNEQQQATNTRKMTITHRLMWVAVAVMLSGGYYMENSQSDARAKSFEKINKMIIESNDSMTKKQDATLKAIIELTSALSKNLDTDATPEEVEETFVEAQKAALEAKKEVADNYIEKAAAEKEIRELDKK